MTRSLHALVLALMALSAVVIAALAQAAPAALRSPRIRDERGDVPGWVLVTVMTAGLVAGLWAVAGPELERMLRQALTSVS
jgi:hypothetical protein